MQWQLGFRSNYLGSMTWRIGGGCQKSLLLEKYDEGATFEIREHLEVRNRRGWNPIVATTAFSRLSAWRRQGREQIRCPME